MSSIINIPSELSSRNPLIQKSVETKGFYLYNWISFEELRKTVARDYLRLLSKMLMPLGVIVMVGGIYNFYALHDIYFRWTLIGLASVYALILCIIILRMVVRSWTFLHISNIVFTDSYLGIDGKIIPYSQYGFLENSVEKWGVEFEEELMEPSKLDEKIGEFKSKIFAWGECLVGGSKPHSWESSWTDIELDKDGMRAIGLLAVLFTFAISVTFVTYWVSIRVFYALGWTFSFLIGYTFVGIMKLVVTIQGREEMKINQLFEKLEAISSEITISKNMILRDLMDASEGIWKNGTPAIAEGLRNTVGKAWTGVNITQNLKNLLKNSKYSKVFNFETFNTWTKNQILEPINEMIGLLSSSLEKLDASIVSLKEQIQVTKDPSFVVPLETQLKRLEAQRSTFVTLQDQWKGVGAKLVIGEALTPPLSQSERGNQ